MNENYNKMQNVPDNQKAWFAHSVNLINETQLFLFGGAIENQPTIYVTTNDSYLVDKNTLEWTKL